MNFTDDFLQHAQDCIETVFRANRDVLIAANGTAKTEFKADKTAVTEFDRQMELDLEKVLQPLDNGIGYQGEEFGHKGNDQTFWLVDPIDGTENFVRGLPFFRNMATLIDNGKPVFTVVYRVLSDEMFVARQGGGTYRDGQKLTVSQRPLERMRLELSCTTTDVAVWSDIAVLEERIEAIRTTDEFLYVVEGKLDAHLVYKSDTKPWDNAPRMLLMAETGAKVANLGSDAYDYTQGDWLAANPAVFDQIAKIFRT